MASNRAAVSVPLLRRTVTILAGFFATTLVCEIELDMLVAVFLAVADGMVKYFLQS